MATVLLEGYLWCYSKDESFDSTVSLRGTDSLGSTTDHRDTPCDDEYLSTPLLHRTYTILTRSLGHVARDVVSRWTHINHILSLRILKLYSYLESAVSLQDIAIKGLQWIDQCSCTFLEWDTRVKSLQRNTWRSRTFHASNIQLEVKCL